MNYVNQFSFRFNVVLLILVMIVMSISFTHALSTSFQVVSTGDNYTELEFNLQDYEYILNKVDGVEYQRIYHPEAGYIFEEGLPEIPFFTVMLAIPERGIASIEELKVTATEIRENILFFPSQGPDMVISDELGFLYDNEFYKQDVSYPAKLMDIGTPAILRDYRTVSLVVYPFSYNPLRRELTVHQNIRLRVNYDRTFPGENEIDRPSRRLSRSFENIYQGALLNYWQFRNPDLEYQARSILVIHHHSTLITPVVNEFVNWKRDKGFEIFAKDTADLSNNTAIKNYIQNAYNTWENPPEYIVLIGGGSGSFTIPTTSGYGATTDHIYGLLEGNDDIPDTFVGRFPFGNLDQLMVIWEKIENYERYPYLDNINWYQHSLLVGDGTTSSGESPRITIRYVKEIMQRYNPSFQFTEHYNGSATTVINNAFNQGIAFFPFRGYIGMAGWSPNASSLSNGLMLPNCFFMTCSTLYFDNSSKAEAIVNMGIVGEPKGAVATVGMNTASTKTAFNNAYTGAFFYGIFNEGIRTMGETLVRGKIFLHQTWDIMHSSEVPYHTHKASLMGDPSMDIWVENPKQLNVAYNQLLPLGTNYLDLTVTDEFSQPVENAWVTLRQVVGNDETLFVTGYTDENGNITHFFSSDTNGTVKVTVTKPDYIPHHGTFSFDGGPSVSLHSLFVNGVPNAGNQVGFVLNLKNYLGRQAYSLNATLSSESEYVNIIQNYSTYPNIVAGGTGQSINEYIIEIAPDTPSGHTVLMDLNVNESLVNNWTSRFPLTVNNGNLVPTNITFTGDLPLEPGQTSEMFVTLHNNGNIGLTDLYGTISGGGDGLSIIDPTAYFGNITSGGTITNSSNNFVLSASGVIVPGTIFYLDLLLYNSAGFEQTVQLTLTIGTVTVDDPLGPDAYGYRCYDSGDVDHFLAPEYDWIEIVPTLGGNGTNTGLQSDHVNLHQVISMDLPFTFRFYGIDYDIISICANGWASFGVTEQSTFRNYRLPGPMGPAAMIAAFWDNLSTSAGGVYTYYNQNESIFIIQWQNMLNRVGNAEETFQIILYDPAVYMTSTGDGNIKIQYKVFNNVNNQASPEWGNYSTVGIADHTESVGMTYTFANVYPTAARPITNESAIFFTTDSINPDYAYVIIENISYSGGVSNLPQFGETLSMSMTLNNIGGTTAGEVTATLSTNDQYVNIIDNTEYFGVIGVEELVSVDNAFSISIADNVPDQHQAHMTLTMQSDLDLSWQQSFTILIQAPNLQTEDLLIYDFIPHGNNDGIIDPGEMITVSVPVRNIGAANSPEVSMSFVSNHPQVSILDISYDNASQLLSGQTIYPTLLLDIGAGIEIGTFFTIGYTIEYGNYINNGNINLNVGGSFTVQMGSGTATNGTTTANPINIWYRSQRGQTVYPAAELNAAGMIAGGLLTEFGFYVTSPPAYALPNFIIRMKHTTATDASSHDYGPYETVLLIPSYMPVAGGWDMLTLDTPFQWNGVDNILVDTAFAQVPNYNASGQQRIYTVSNGYRYVWNDNSDQTNAVTTTSTSNKPQAQMVFFGVSAGDVETRPLNLTSDFIDDAVYLEWDPPAAAYAALSDHDNTDFLQREADRSRNRSSGILRNEGDRTLQGYNVYRNGIKINQQLVINTNYYDFNLETLEEYYYYVTAIYDSEESIPSNIVYVELENRVATPNFDPIGG
ncbi:MAG: hypothetical protein K0B81_08735, partial [Candidatus Cloacimonetes bacterium]|nr:hypothetical protein [Candidatus Cloacimonadota bacterium]